MKATIISATFEKEYTDKFGTKYSHKIIFVDDNLEEITGFYSSKYKDQKYFKKGEEAEFITEEMKSGNHTWLKIKPVKNSFQSNYGRAIKKEQSRYSGFAVSYVKDLIIADKLPIGDWEKASKKIFQFMVDLDKTLDA